MIDIKTLKKRCAACRQTDYEKCKKCSIYRTLNRRCELCGGMPAFPFIHATGKGLSKIYVCKRCMDKLT